MKKQKALRPQDIVVALKLALEKKSRISQADLANSLCISAAEVYNSIERLQYAKLLDSEKKPILRNLRNLIVHGVPFFYPAEIGPIQRGIGIAHSGPFLKQKIRSSREDKFVWPDPEGKDYGQSVKPLFKSVPKASKVDKRLYELLSLVEALRVGKARERNLAENQIIGALV